MNTFQIRTSFPFAFRRPVMHFFGLAGLAWLLDSQGFRILSVSFSVCASLALLLLIWSESLKAIEFRADGFSFLDGNRVAAYRATDMKAIAVLRRFPGTYFLHVKTEKDSLALRYLTPHQNNQVAEWAAAQGISISQASPWGLWDIFSLFS